MTELAVVAAVFAATSLLRARVGSWLLSTPIIFVAVGIILSPEVTGVLDLELEGEAEILIAELTLAVLLFADASRIDVRTLRPTLAIPARLLLIGLPLSVIMGTVLTRMLLPDLTWSQAGLVAAILSPTDAALGQAVVSDPAVPVRIRQALNVESGLNDGLIVPVVSVFAVLAAGAAIEGPATIVGEALGEVAIGVVIGVVGGIVLAALLEAAIARGLTDVEGARLATLGGGLAVFGLAVVTGGNGFIAAFVCGLTLGYRLSAMAHEAVDLAEDAGQIGASVAFVLFGALMVIPALEILSLPIVVCAIGTLTLGRMIPVALSMLGAGLRPPTVAFLGWFGPRGLASILFGLIVVGNGTVPEAGDLFAIITLVVVASVVLHGVTAVPGARRYGQWFGAQVDEDTMEEAMDVPDTPVRWAPRLLGQLTRNHGGTATGAGGTP